MNLIEELRSLAGADEDADTFETRSGDTLLRVSYSGGSSSSVTISAPFDRAVATKVRRPAAARQAPLCAPRPLGITLRLETGHDRRGKASRIAVEVQTGDAEFDELVYIDTLARPDIVRAVLRDEAARRAVRELLALGFTRVILDDDGGNVSVTTTEFVNPSPDRGRGRRALSALDQLSCALPRVVAQGAEPPVDPVPRWLTMGGAAAAFAVVGGAVWMTKAAPKRCTTAVSPHGSVVFDSIHCSSGPECCEPFWQGALAGTALTVATMQLVLRAIRGGSSSHRQLRVARVILFVFCVAVSVVVAALVRW